MGTPLPQQPAQAVTATAGPAGRVPVAMLARTSTLALQDPLASLRRQIRSGQEWLPPGWYIAAYYWDIESGGIDLERRSQGEAWKQFAAAGIPRDGGMADLLTEAKAPAPRFAAVVCEDIERSARDTFNALKLERELSGQGIPLFATDEPANIEGINATTVLVRRVKQGVAEWLRLQIKEKAWKGLKEHSLAGWNIGPAPYGYAAERIPHPVPAKAAQGRHKTRLVPDPVRGPIITLIYHWRAEQRLSVSTIAARLNAGPGRYPAPGHQPGWTEQAIAAMLANPKYTGYMVLGRTRKIGGTTRPMPPDQWLWSPEPTHTALVDKHMWDAAQRTGAERGNTRDPEMPTTQPGRRYLLRSRVRCRICQRRMCGNTSTAPSYYKTEPGNTYTYYRCPHNRSNPRHVAAHPDHPSVSVRQDTLMDTLAGFFTDRVFGPDRAAMLAEQLPASAAEETARRAARAAALRTQLARIDASERGLIRELDDTPAGPGDTAAHAYRARIRERFTERHADRTRAETELAQLSAAATSDNDPALLDELPILGDVLTDAPARLIEQLLAAFDIQALYSKDTHQATIWATLTDATPRAINALLTDPRTGSDTGTGAPAPASEAAPAQDHFGDLANDRM